jgi:hypothetical protein
MEAGLSNPMMKKIEKRLRETLAIAGGALESESLRIRRTYRTHLLDDNCEYVGICDEYPSLSWIASTEAEALRGIMILVANTEAETNDGGKSASA